MRFLACCSILAALPVTAQITVLDSVPGELLELRTLRTSGQKFIENPVNTYPNVNIYNTDLTPYATFTVPPPPVGYTYTLYGYFTEDLFDTDPLTIEYMVLASPSMPPNLQRLFIYRADGTVLTAFVPGSLAFNDFMGMSQGPVFNTASGTVMVVRRNYITQSLLVSLPGTLPCMDCAGMVMFGGEAERNVTTGSVRAFPNPATHAITVQYSLPGGTGGHVVLFDALGAEVRRLALVQPQGSVEIGTAGLRAGTYRCEVFAVDGQHTGASIVVVE